MKFTKARMPPRTRGNVLTDGEMAALRAIFLREPATAEMYEHLLKLGVIEQKLGQWRLTEDGHIRLWLASSR